MEPKLFIGGQHSDQRGKIKFNNDFDAREVKRIYIIKNENTETIRGWQGHKIEQRWFSAVSGSFKILLIKIENWEQPAQDLPILEFILSSETLGSLYLPPGYISAIKSLEDDSKLLVMADYGLHEITDEYRFPLEYFNNYTKQ